MRPAFIYARAATELIDKDDDDLTYPKRFLYGAYAETKARAEKLVLAAASSNFYTASIRPCGVYGERDRWHLPNVLESARTGMLSMRVGQPRTVFQHVYVDNVAYAHVCALKTLLRAPETISGQAFIITDYAAENFW